jgi:hypothetical protein
MLMGSCKKKMVCPAYQSQFILDKQTADVRFSGFQIVESDTVPHEVKPHDKFKYGLMPRLSERKKWKQVRTVEMKLLFAEKADTSASIIVLGDSTGEVSSDVSREPLTTEINVDQANYFIILGPLLPRPKEKKESEKKVEGKEEEPLSKVERQLRKEQEKEERKKMRKGEAPPVRYLLPEELLNEDGTDPRENRPKQTKPVVEEEEPTDPER